MIFQILSLKTFLFFSLPLSGYEYVRTVRTLHMCTYICIYLHAQHIVCCMRGGEGGVYLNEREKKEDDASICVDSRYWILDIGYWILDIGYLLGCSVYIPCMYVCMYVCM